MSNPVAPPPSAGDGSLPPANQGFGDAPEPGQPYGAPPVGGQPYGAPPVGGQPYGAPPVGGQPYGAPPVDGQSVPGQPVPGQPYGDPAQQGFGSPSAFPAEPKKKNAFGRIALRIVAAVVVFVIVLVARNAFFGDKAKDAAVGDCVASSQNVKVDEETEAKAEVVDCSSAEAAFTVVGRVDGETSTQSKSCEKFFKENEEYYVYSSEASGGYLLCLRPKAA